MITGAVTCDAGITAILSSLIASIDEQAGTNNRRIQCSKRFMSFMSTSEDLRNRVLEFYSYMDNELNNIDEIEILKELSSNMRSEILRYFCFDPLRQTHLFSGFSDGAIMSLVQVMSSYLAVPGEKLTEVGSVCESIYILQRGMMRIVDSNGAENFAPLGSVVGHRVSKATFASQGNMRKGLQIELKGIKGRYQNAYVVYSVGHFRCRGSIQKSQDWTESTILKLPKCHDSLMCIKVKSWQRGPRHTDIGSATIDLSAAASGDEFNVVITDSQNKKSGMLRMRVTISALNQYDIPVSHEVTTIATGFCHLYKLDCCKIDDLQEFLSYRLGLDLDGRFTNEERTEEGRLEIDNSRISNTHSSCSQVESLSESPEYQSRYHHDRVLPINVDKDSIGGRPNWLDRFRKSASICPTRPNTSTGVENFHTNSDRNNTLRRTCINQSSRFHESSVSKKDSTSSCKTVDRSLEIIEEEKRWDVLVDLSQFYSTVNSPNRALSSFFIEWGH